MDRERHWHAGCRSPDPSRTFTNAPVEAQVAFGIICNPDVATYAAGVQHFVMHVPGYRFADGTDEIRRTIIAERVLGFSGEIRNDRRVPFRELPSGRYREGYAAICPWRERARSLSGIMAGRRF